MLEEKEGGLQRFFAKGSLGESAHHRYYETPRSYACGPFDIKKEIIGSVERIAEIAPKGKGAKLIQWSGDTSPYEEALRVTREAGLYNINGGDSRFDTEYPSYASVSPIGLEVGKERQIYSSNSNENTYTNLWTDRFYGFVYLQSTVRNTEIPMRVQPFNIYYHMYSGEKKASLAALKSNVEFARAQPLSRMFASDFAAIANGFYTTRLLPEGEGVWRVRDRGALNTLRLDNAVLKTVDFENSEGVLGQKYFQGSLYVSLDPRAEEPVVALKDKDVAENYNKSTAPYLIESAWRIKRLTYVNKSLMFTAQGFGDGRMVFKLPEPGRYEIAVSRKGKNVTRHEARTDREGELHLVLALDARVPVLVSITKKQ
jgi:hypothetical protein